MYMSLGIYLISPILLKRKEQKRISSQRIAMPTQIDQLHFVLFPFMAQGHMIPMIDIARLLAERGVIISIVTTPLNATRFRRPLTRAIESGNVDIRLIEIHFPCVEAGLPEGCECFDMMPSLGLAANFFTAADMLQQPVENLFQDLKPKPNCLISDMCLPYTTDISSKFHIPRISFHGTSCFCLLCVHCVLTSKVLDNIHSNSEYFMVPYLPHKVAFTKPQIFGLAEVFHKFSEKMQKADLFAYGTIVNSFEELEPDYAKGYKKVKDDKVWCIGPVSLRNKEHFDMAQRGNRTSIDENICIKWLDSQENNSVIYVCFGSLCNLLPLQLIEVGLGLEASNRPFMWVIREGDTSKELKKWVLENKFEERIKGRGILIWGWAPQVLILSRPSIGAFLTHCGWNSTLEAISAGLPLVTWPLFGDQFCNEKFVVQIVKTGVSIGVEEHMTWGEEEKVGVIVKKEDVKAAIERVMAKDKEGEERRERARELGKMAKRVVEEGGSSHHNITVLLEDIKEQTNFKVIEFGPTNC